MHRRENRNAIGQLIAVCMLMFAATVAWAAVAVPAESAVPLVIGHRTIHTFRAPLGMFSASDRADGARRRIDAAFQKAGDGWTSVKTTDQGIQVELDGQPLFYVLAGDVRELAGETPADLANQASRLLRLAWEEHRERSDPKASLHALLKVGIAAVLLVILLTLTIKVSSRLRAALVERMPGVFSTIARHLNDHTVRIISSMTDRLLVVATWLFGMLLIFIFSTFSLNQFVLTRPASETLLNSIVSLGSDALMEVTASLPRIFIAAVIFLLTWVFTRVSSEFFDNVEIRSAEGGWLNPHTAPATRRIINALLWLFAIAMAYPYLPGSHTEAFKGLSMMVGLMISIGAAGVVGQIASGIILVYTYALKHGEYVRIQDYEGTVTELGLFVTRLRTGMGEEIAIPNAVVLGTVTRNFSRIQSSAGKSGYVLDTTVTIGYDTPWRQVHAMLVEAAKSTPGILQDPEPYVVQTALSDFYVAYKLVVYVGTDVPAARAQVASDLHAAIQDSFNSYGVQIMSPHYFGDPAASKIVQETSWYEPPAREKDAK
ncbi:mechanosensitive ion channel family protein [Propionivibrio dicarboxylicus]|uniref:Small-conductance mechanosensitive channel n=1 Tax=Propionivibrio dicarboxylicus TaxID=83767 RepID=A0A1G8FX30_9RHOO|nr:mechanosensitive ion channel domain-containing protein [Propionivibrio dicarboxylicus]SDH86526.1 Mechanosensitive ion channel [Propionivibrio dicarboxylicus]